MAAAMRSKARSDGQCYALSGFVFSSVYACGHSTVTDTVKPASQSQHGIDHFPFATGLWERSQNLYILGAVALFWS